MQRAIRTIFVSLFMLFSLVMAQTNEWATEYATFDDQDNGTGNQTSSMAVVGPNRFIALVPSTPDSPVLDNLFTVPGCYIVGYWDADSALGRVLSPINGEMKFPEYGIDEQYSTWEFSLDQVQLAGAWQMAAGNNDSNWVYIANNDEFHNILVFKLTPDGVESTPYRMETGTDNNIYAIEVDTAGYVYVADFLGDNVKTDEIKVYAGIGFPGTTWEGFGGHTDAPVTTIDLPEGRYHGLTVSPDGSQLFVSYSSERSVVKYTGDPVGGYTLDNDFTFVLDPGDTLGVPASEPAIDTLATGTPTTLGLAFSEDPDVVYAVADVFVGIGLYSGYNYGRIYVLNAKYGSAEDTIDIAAWNHAVTGAYNTGSGNGRAGGFTSVTDVEYESDEKAVYTQTYYGWAVEKWLFDGDLGDIVGSVERITDRLPQEFNLMQNFPNPFNPATTIEFDINKTEFVTLEVFNTVGQKISTLLKGTLKAGVYSISFDGRNLPSGIYFYQLSAGGQKAVKKMVLTK